MVAKFREKCAMAEKTLQWLIKTTNSRNAIQLVANELKIEPASESKAMAPAKTLNATTFDDNIELVECIADTIDDHPEYMIIENDETTTESDDATEQIDDGQIEMSNIVEESAEVSGSFLREKRNPQFDDDLFDWKQEFIQEVEESPKIQIYKNSTSKAVINHSCDYCGAGFAQANNLLRHMQTHDHTEDTSQ